MQHNRDLPLLPVVDTAAGCNSASSDESELSESIWPCLSTCFFLSPRSLNRIIISLNILYEQPTSLDALEQAISNIAFDNRYIARLRKHQYAVTANSSVPAQRRSLSDDHVRYNVAQLRFDFEVLRDGRWSLLIGVWSLGLSVLIAWLSALLAAAPNCSPSA